MNRFKQGDGIMIEHEDGHKEFGEFHRYGESRNGAIIMINGAIRMIDEDSLIPLYNKELLEDQIILAKFMGYRETSIEERIKWCSCQTEERLNKFNPLNIPILVKGEFDEPLFIDTLNYNSYEGIMSVVEEINKRDWVTIYRDECKIHSLEVGEFMDIVVIKEGEQMLNSIFDAAVQYVKVLKQLGKL